VEKVIKKTFEVVNSPQKAREQKQREV